MESFFETRRAGAVCLQDNIAADLGACREAGLRMA
jgi:hypothetical protein